MRFRLTVIPAREASSNLARFDGVKYGYRTEQYDGLPNMYRKPAPKDLRGSEAPYQLGSFVLSSRLLRRLLPKGTPHEGVDQAGV